MSSAQRFSSTQFGFNVYGAMNGSYDVQLSTNLAAGWNPLVSLTLTNVPFLFVDSHATNSQRFYRVKKD